MTADDEQDPFGDASQYEAAIERSIAFAHVGHEVFIEAKANTMLDTITRILGRTQDLDFLDVGCGVGRMQRYVADVARTSVGIDTSAVSIDAASELYPRVDFRTYDGDALPFDSDSFDVAFAVNVLHHVEPPSRGDFLREMARVTRPDGLVFVFDQNPFNPLTRVAVARCEFDEGVVLTTRSSVVDLINASAMDVVDARYVLFFPFDQKWARRAERHLGWLPMGAQYMVVSKPR